MKLQSSKGTWAAKMMRRVTGGVALGVRLTIACDESGRRFCSPTRYPFSSPAIVGRNRVFILCWQESKTLKLQLRGRSLYYYRTAIILPSCCLHLHGRSHLWRSVRLLVVDVIVLIDMIVLIVGFCSKGGGCEHSGVSS